LSSPQQPRRHSGAPARQPQEGRGPGARAGWGGWECSSARRWVRPPPSALLPPPCLDEASHCEREDEGGCQQLWRGPVSCVVAVAAASLQCNWRTAAKGSFTVQFIHHHLIWSVHACAAA
jgi:hypothetical protein